MYSFHGPSKIRTKKLKLSSNQKKECLKLFGSESSFESSSESERESYEFKRSKKEDNILDINVEDDIFELLQSPIRERSREIAARCGLNVKKKINLPEQPPPLPTPTPTPTPTINHDFLTPKKLLNLAQLPSPTSPLSEQKKILFASPIRIGFVTPSKLKQLVKTRPLISPLARTPQAKIERKKIIIISPLAKIAKKIIATRSKPIPANTNATIKQRIIRTITQQPKSKCSIQLKQQLHAPPTSHKFGEAQQNTRLLRKTELSKEHTLAKSHQHPAHAHAQNKINTFKVHERVHATIHNHTVYERYVKRPREISGVYLPLKRVRFEEQHSTASSKHAQAQTASARAHSNNCKTAQVHEAQTEVSRFAKTLTNSNTHTQAVKERIGVKDKEEESHIHLLQQNRSIRNLANANDIVERHNFERDLRIEVKGNIRPTNSIENKIIESLSQTTTTTTASNGTRIINLNNKNVPKGIHLAIAVDKNRYLTKNALKKITRNLANQM